MAVILGIDIGTSSVKGMLLDTEKGVLGVRQNLMEWISQGRDGLSRIRNFGGIL